MTRWLARWLRRMGVDELRLSSDDWRRAVILVVVCALCSLMIVDYSRAPAESLRPGDVAPRTVKAPFPFPYNDQAEYEARRKEAADAVQPVFIYRLNLANELQERISDAFEAGRERLKQLEPSTADEEPHPVDDAEAVEPDPLPPEEAVRQSAGVAFLVALDVHLPAEDVAAVVEAGLPREAELFASQLLRRAMLSPIIRDREGIPRDGGVRVIELRDGERSEYGLADLDHVLTPADARQEVNLGLLDAKLEPSPVMDAAATIARALVRSNLSFDPLQTEERRQAAMAAVDLEITTIKRGAILFRAGDTLTERQVQVYRALQSHHTEGDIAKELLAIGLFLLLLLVSLYQFGSSYLEGFSVRVRDVASVGALLVLTAFLARVVVASSEGIASLIGFEAEPTSVWFAVPVAGVAMLIRLLLGVSWTVIYSLAAATLCGLIMGLQALPMIFFLISGVAAAGAVEHTRERIAVLRAGFYVGVVNAACVLLIHFVQLFAAEGELSLATSIRPLWSMSFAMAGGVASSFLVLGLVPLFESVGFVTDYRMMELANLNHPLLRQLMLRAPGSYHHSVIVGTLAEAGCEAIGANALQAKVSSYFHDVGKSLKPQYFVENQRDNINKHQDLEPHQSARIIISHVIDGGRMAREYNLPQPIIDNIYMHHGTGILQYFFSQAMAEAEDPSTIDESSFRYPGPRPNTREAGVIMLADKVEAATRTIQAPDEHNIRAMISRIVSSVIADGQFADCPLTFQEIHTVADTFVGVLVGIYHQRIEYPQTADVSRSQSDPQAPVRENTPPARKVGAPTPPRNAIITLDLDRPRPVRPPPRPAPIPDPTPLPVMSADEEASEPFPDDEDSEVVDYESIEHLPGREG